MKNAARFSKLLKELSRDSRLKRAVAKGRRRSHAKRRSQIENLLDMCLLFSAVASRFLKKKKARALDKQMDIVYFLVQVSLLLKENIFDRPEVQEFFGRNARQIRLMVGESLGRMPQPKRLRSRPDPRESLGRMPQRKRPRSRPAR